MGLDMDHSSSSVSSLPRRRFLGAAVSALGLAPMVWVRGQNASPNDEITMGIIGTGGMGMGNMGSFLNIAGVRVVAVCDVDKGRVAAAKAKVDGKYKNQDCKAFGNYRDLLAVPGLDAVCLSLPDHQHAEVGIAAANAGMDIYGEKPFTWGLAEGRELVKAVRKNKRIWQTGCWQRSTGEFRRFRALIQNDALGKLTRFECGTPKGMSIKRHVPDDQVAALIGKPPENLDWAGWCGPVKDFAFHPLLHPWNWRWHNTFGGGQLLDWVGHHVDIALWTLKLDGTGPVKVEGTGKKSTHDFFDTYVEYEYKGTFEDGRVLEVRSNFMGTKFTGENGWIHADRGKINASDPELLRRLPEGYDPKITNHHQDFINCVRSRQTTIAPEEAAHRAASFGMLGIVAIDSGAPLKWDPAAEKVLDNADQAAHPRLGSRLG